jgi:hypothetical protein
MLFIGITERQFIADEVLLLLKITNTLQIISCKAITENDVEELWNRSSTLYQVYLLGHACAVVTAF